MALQLGECKPEDLPDDVVQKVAEVLRTSSALKVSDSGFQVGKGRVIRTVAADQ